MRHRIVTLSLLVALALGLAVLVPELTALRLPRDHSGYEPTQPIAFSHRLHAGELEIDCRYCHAGAARSPAAGIPAADLCMNCHRLITAPRSAVRGEELAAEAEGREPRRVVSPELAKLYRALGLGPDLEPAPGLAPEPIAWVRVHQLPDFAVFDHRPHVAAGVACQKCHGAVETMERVRQVESLLMGWCVECHRDPYGAGVAPAEATPVASIDCAVCHH